jgi:hypothetical protein
MESILRIIAFYINSWSAITLQVQLDLLDPICSWDLKFTQVCYTQSDTISWTPDQLWESLCCQQDSTMVQQFCLLLHIVFSDRLTSRGLLPHFPGLKPHNFCRKKCMYSNNCCTENDCKGCIQSTVFEVSPAELQHKMNTITDRRLQGAFRMNLDSPNLQPFYLQAEY